MMMAAEMRSPTLLERLPAVRGRYTENAALDRITWFKVGGPAEVMFRPADEEDLIQFMTEKPADVPLTVIGVGSNSLIRDGGIPGVVVRLGRGLAGITVDGTEITAGASALDVNVAITARAAGLAGLEFLSGIPGTLGGALRMNAGAFDAEMKDVTLSARALDDSGRVHDLSPAELGFSYRHCDVAEDWIFLSARLGGTPGDTAEIARRMARIRAQRETSQPVRTATGGSTFANPPGRKAWRLIDQAGCRGLNRGGAMVSEKHCNFLINTGNATAADLEGLGEEVRRRVFEHSGVALEWEIRRLGVSVGGPLRDSGRTSS